jgi:hypothetical protein
MQNSVSLACYTTNATMLSDALDRAMAVVTVSSVGIDGSALVSASGSANPRTSSQTSRLRTAFIAMVVSCSTTVFYTTATMARIWWVEFP